MAFPYFFENRKFRKSKEEEARMNLPRLGHRSCQKRVDSGGHFESGPSTGKPICNMQAHRQARGELMQKSTWHEPPRHGRGMFEPLQIQPASSHPHSAVAYAPFASFAGTAEVEIKALVVEAHRFRSRPRRCNARGL